MPSTLRVSRRHNGDASFSQKSSTLKGLEAFDILPDHARTTLPVVCGLFAISKATAWRRVKSGLLPEPVREGGTTRWIVGDLRRALAK